MEKKRSKGVTIFGILIILGALYQLPVAMETYKILFQPLPESIIQARHLLIKILLILGAVSGIGILRLKNVFRKIMITIFLPAFK